MSSGYVALADFDRLERRVKVLERQIAEYRRKEQAVHPIETVRVNAAGQAEVQQVVHVVDMSSGRLYCGKVPKGTDAVTVNSFRAPPTCEGCIEGTRMGNHRQPTSTAGHRSDGATPVEHIESCS
jgi:hypothetical protein